MVLGMVIPDAWCVYASCTSVLKAVSMFSAFFLRFCEWVMCAIIYGFIHGGCTPEVNDDKVGLSVKYWRLGGWLKINKQKVCGRKKCWVLLILFGLVWHVEPCLI